MKYIDANELRPGMRLFFRFIGEPSRAHWQRATLIAKISDNYVALRPDDYPPRIIIPVTTIEFAVLDPEIDAAMAELTRSGRTPKTQE